MIHLYNGSSLPVSPWRNGGGETREIVSYPPGVAEFDWRISIATIAADGEFSSFPGVDRIITLLSGDGVTLFSGDRLRQRLALHRPFSFSGEEAINARLSGGVSTDFNIMSRRDRCRADAGTATSTFTPAAAAGGVVYVLGGRWQHGQTLLGEGQGAWWENQGGSFSPLTAGALLLWGTLYSAASRAP